MVGLGIENVLEAICHNRDWIFPLDASVNIVLVFRHEGPTVKLADGDAEMVIGFVVKPGQPLLDKAVNDTLYTLAEAYVWVGVCCAEVPVSPNCQFHEMMLLSVGGGVLF